MMTSSQLCARQSESMEQEGLTQEQIIGFQAKLWALLGEQAKRFTMGESTSLPKELAQELLESICFTLGIDEAHPAAGIKRLEKADLALQYRLGRNAIAEKMDIGRALWQAACKSVPGIPNRALQDTLRGIGQFWKRYDHCFFAHQIPCDIDYPLCHPVEETLHGVEYVNEYLKRLLIESSLLNRFSHQRCIRVLQGYCRDYKGLHINLYEPVAVNALGLSLLGQDPLALEISPQQRKMLEDQLLWLGREERQAMLQQGVQHMCRALSIRHSGAKAYLLELARDLQPRLEVALACGDLSGIFLPGCSATAG